MTDSPAPSPSLSDYARGELRGEAVYRGYRPRAALLDEVRRRLPRAHVLVVSGAWCPDCRREVPKMARVLEHLAPGWSVELRHDDDVTRSRFGVRAIPSFLVLDGPDGRELGRIIESPRGDQGLEGDLLAIAAEASADSDEGERVA